MKLIMFGAQKRILHMLKVSGIKFPAFALALVLAVLAGVSQSASAATMVEYQVDVGWYDNTGLHYPDSTNYLAGKSVYNNTATTFHNWALFDLTDVSDTIVDASLGIYINTRGYSSADASETYGLFDVSTPIANLQAGGTGLTGIYDDLGTGNLLGSTSISEADEGSHVNIVFNAAGIAYLNAHLGQFVALGGRVTSLSADDTRSEGVFGFSGEGTTFPYTGSTSGSHVLTLNANAVTSGAVPEPATAALGMMTLVGLAAASRRRK